MMSKVKRFLIRTCYRAVYPLRELYWFVFKPKTRGTRVVIFWQDKVLLVHLSYGNHQWIFPGGGVKRGESYEAAAIRETAEEAGIHLAHVEFFHEYVFDERNSVQCFAAEVSFGDFTVDGTEIVEAGWFTADALPKGTGLRVKKILDACHEWKQEQTRSISSV